MMKLLVCFSCLISLSAWSAPCGGAQVGYWTNPDGSRGGSVAPTAKVQKGAVIAPNASVCERAEVKSGAQILGQAKISGRAVIYAGAEIDGRARVEGEARIGGGGGVTKIGGDALIEGSAVVTGATQIFARAKVGGGAKVHNSVICQASVIEGISVIDSDYYCQTEDPEPAMPSEALAKATLLGVDSDRDGVRDDVEIWINERFSNTPAKDMYNYRMAYKAFAAGSQKAFKYKDSKTQAMSAMNEVLDAQRCVTSFQVKGKNLNERLAQIREAANLEDDLTLLIKNTKDRIKADIQIRHYFHGELLVGTKKNKSGCTFEKR